MWFAGVAVALVALVWTLYYDVVKAPQRSGYHTGEHTFFTVIPSVVLLVLVLLAVCSVVGHTDDLGTIRAQATIISVMEQRLVDLRTDMSSLRDSSPGAQFMNADTPIKALIDQIAQANNDLAIARVTKANAEVSIAKRKAGPMWFVVSMYGEP